MIGRRTPAVDVEPDRMVLDGYVRVSQVRGRDGDSFISPHVQREQIEAWAALRGARVQKIFEELDVSGARVDRPLLEEAIARIETGTSEGLVVAKLDRFGRSLIHSLAAIERIHSAGGTFASVQDGLDLTTDTGRLVLRIMLSLAEFELDRIRSGWRTARARAIARGIHMGGRPPAGYERDEHRRLRPHPHHGPVVGEVFARRAAGATLLQLVRFLENAGVPTAFGRERWSIRGLRVLLSNRVYLGELRNGDLARSGAHPALTDPMTWQLAQASRRSAHTPHGRPNLLAGLLECAACGRVMRTHATVRAGRRRRTYVCVEAGCSNRAHVGAAVIEPHVEGCFFAILDEQRRPPELRSLERAAAIADADLVGFRDDPAILRALGPERFADGLAVRAKAERKAVAAVAGARDSSPVLEPGRDGWERRWPEMSVIERRRTIAALVEKASVVAGAAPIEMRATVYQRGAADPVVPPPLVARWSERRIDTELRAFVGDQWPDDEAFVAAGRGPLLREIHATGGPPRWARRVRAAAVPRRARGYWTDDRIRTALTAIMADRKTWPSRRELKALGYGGLYSAMRRRGGRTWEREFGYAERPGVPNGRRWTEESVVAALVTLCEGRSTYPSRTDFQIVGLDGLHHAIRVHHGGHQRWADRMGLPRSRRPRPRPSVARWTDELVEQRLRRAIAELRLSRYPLQREFYSVGEGGLHRHIRATRGHSWWAQRLGLPRARGA